MMTGGKNLLKKGEGAENDGEKQKRKRKAWRRWEYDSNNRVIQIIMMEEMRSYSLLSLVKATV